MKDSFKKYIAEGVLIVFSVLFALFINAFFSKYQTSQKKQVAINSIKKEMQKNRGIIIEWEKTHSDINTKIASLILGENDSLKAKLQTYSFLNLNLLTNGRSLVDAVLTKTAWESTKSTGIISEFDFSFTQKAIHTYQVQEILTDKTLTRLLDFYFSLECHNIDNLDATLVQFQLYFMELVEQERIMIKLLDDNLKYFENENY